MMSSFLVRSAFTFLVLAASTASTALATDFPLGPDPGLTPGSLCDHASSIRYPEKIRYCERNVDSDLKKQIIREYDEELGFNVRRMSRAKFKIDHFIPLCAGGSNKENNLWPQHESVYKITDPLEAPLCEKMAAGRLLQAEAIKLIQTAKHDLSKAPEILHYIESL